MRKIMANHICYKVIKGKLVSKTFKGNIIFEDNGLSFKTRTKDVLNIWEEEVTLLYSDIVEIRTRDFGVFKTGIVLTTNKDVHTFAVNSRDLIVDYIREKMNKGD